MKNWLLIIAIFFFPSFGFSQIISDRSDGWQKVEACGAAFLLLADMKAPYKGQLGMHKCVEVFENNSMSIYIETDAFPPFGSGESTISKFKEYAEKPYFKRSKIKIGARKAIIVTYVNASEGKALPYSAAFSIFSEGGFRMHVSMKNAEDKILAEKIFRSVQILEK